MKNQSIKVILSFSAKKTPDWFHFLSAVDSGFVRAELLRKHLKAPGTVQIWPGNNSTPTDADTPAETLPSKEPKPASIAAPASPSMPSMQLPAIQEAPASQPSTAQIHGAKAPEQAPESLADSLLKGGSVKW